MNELSTDATNNVDLFGIELTRKPAVFRAGETLEGKVILVLSHRLPFLSLKLRIDGKADVSWNKESGIAVHSESVYVKEKMVLAKPDKGDRGALQAGRNEFKFRKRLDPSAPTSVEGKHGSVRYTCKVVLTHPKVLGGSQPSAKIKTFAVKGFTVIQPKPLSAMPAEFLENHVITGSRPGGLCLCHRGDLFYEVNVARLAFIPGESIPFEGTIENRGQGRIESATVRIVMFVDFQAGNEETRFSKLVCETTLVMYVDPGACVRVDRWVALPPLCPSTQIPGSSRSPGQQPSLIRTSYELHFAIQRNFRKPIESTLPLVIGTEPLKTVAQDDVMLREPYWERKVDLTAPGQRYFVSDAEELQLVNRYPFFVKHNPRR